MTIRNGSVRGMRAGLACQKRFSGRLGVALVVLCAAGLGTPGLYAAAPAAARPVSESPAALHEELESLRAETTELRRQIAALRAEATTASVATRVADVETRLAKLAAALAAYGERLGTEEAANKGHDDAISALEDQQASANHLSVYGSLAYHDESAAGAAFDAEAIELVISGRPHPRLGVFTEIELERAAAVGGARGGEVVVEQAWASYAMSPAFNLRGGVLLVPFGAVNADHYAPTRDVISKPLPAVAVSPADWTDNGVSLFGRAVLGSDWVLSYDSLWGAGLGADLKASGLHDARQPFGVDNNGNGALAARFALRRGDGLELGLSGYRGAWDDRGRKLLSGWATDVTISFGPLALRGDFERLIARRSQGLDDVDYQGWYARSVYRLPGALLRRGWHGKAFPEAIVELVAQWDGARTRVPLGDLVADDALFTSRERRLTIGLNYRPTRFWVLKVNHERSRGRGVPLVRGTGAAWLAALGFVF